MTMSRTESHDYATATRVRVDRNGYENPEMRMECKCGKTSRWTGAYHVLAIQQECHAEAASQ